MALSLSYHAHIFHFCQPQLELVNIMVINCIIWTWCYLITNPILGSHYLIQLRRSYKLVVVKFRTIEHDGNKLLELKKIVRKMFNLINLFFFFFFPKERFMKNFIPHNFHIIYKSMSQFSFLFLFFIFYFQGVGRLYVHI